MFASAGAGPVFRWPPRLGRRVRVRGGRLEPEAGDGSAVAMMCEYNEPVLLHDFSIIGLEIDC